MNPYRLGNDVSRSLICQLPSFGPTNRSLMIACTIAGNGVVVGDNVMSDQIIEFS